MLGLRTWALHHYVIPYRPTVWRSWLEEVGDASIGRHIDVVE